VSRDVLQWAVGTQQQQRRGLLMSKAQIAAYNCAQLASVTYGRVLKVHGEMKWG